MGTAGRAPAVVVLDDRAEIERNVYPFRKRLQSNCAFERRTDSSSSAFETVDEYNGGWEEIN